MDSRPGEGWDPDLEGGPGPRRGTRTSKERPSASPRAPLQVDWWPIRDATCPEAFPLHAGTRTAPVDLVCAPCALRQIMPRQGPCAHKQCPKPYESSGQWHWLPEGWDPSDIRSGATCVCKKAGCLRHFEMREPKKKPGRKRSRSADSPPGAVEAPGRDDPCMPARYTVREVTEIWGLRCAAVDPRTAARPHARRARGSTVRTPAAVPSPLEETSRGD